MAFSAGRSLASGLSRHLTRRLHPSLPHLVPSHHDRSEDPSCSSAPPPPTQQPSRFPFSDLHRRSRSQNLTLPLPFGAHRNFYTTSSSGAEVDAAAGVLSDAAAGQMDVTAGVLSDAASSVVPSFPAPFPGEAAAAAADSFLPVAAVQYLIDAVHSFTGLNWWASIALTTVLVRTATIPLIVRQSKSKRKYDALRPQVKAINKDMQNSTEPRSKQERNNKLTELFRKHGVSRLTPYMHLFIQGPIFLSFSCAIQNMIEKVPSLKGGGAYWFTDLTTPDELYILPVLTSMAFAADEINIKARLAGSPKLQRVLIMNTILAVLMMPLTMSFCKAHFCYWVPWTLFSVTYRYANRLPAVRQFLNLPPIVPPWSVPATRVPAPEGPKPVPAVDSPPAAGASAQSSSESSDRSIDPEKKRRTPRVITDRVRE
uniref:Uncharacterized protein n=1 Tax=Avena sativa TaxID=4498 RepID=A0ACD5WPN3_AVESA